MIPSTKKRIIIADDHPIVREGLRELIERDDRFTVVGEAMNGEEALTYIAGYAPDAVILDVEMPKKSGLDVAQYIYLKELPVKVLILTMFNQESVFNRAMDLGVLGYVLKDSVGADIIRGLLAVMNGEYFISPSLSGYTKRDKREPSQKKRPRNLDELTQSERRVFELITQSKTTNQIAEELYISPRTVEHHREHICQKLNLSGSYALLRFALDQKGLPGKI